MRRYIITLAISLLSVSTFAGITTYTFTSINWASKNGTTVCDNISDGWLCDAVASEMGTGRNDAQGRLMYAGVGIKTGTSGAGATSVASFTNVRQLTFNFCQNSSKGRGVIYVQVGSAPADSIVINKPATSGEGVYNRDSVLRLSVPASGQIRFWVKCTENGIYLNSLSIRAEEGGASPFTVASYQLVSDVSQLQEGDQVILGVPSANVVMGYFDESVSKNNIHAIRGTFSTDGTIVEPSDEAVYTLHKTVIHDSVECFVFQDELRYEEAYLVASGGQSKNRLALWTHCYDEGTYGYYGYWTISIAPDGDATICSLGNSVGKYLQYNAGNTPTLFACYANLSQTPVKIYRRVEALGDIPAIVAPLVNFGTTVLTAGETKTLTRTITVNANRLTTDITASVSGAPFSLQETTIDRDGGTLTIRCNAAAPGHYTGTLLLSSDSITTQVTLLADIVAPMTIREAVSAADYDMVYLQPVEVTKKYDTYIFVRDTTGSMLIYDNGNGAGGRYGSGLQSGDILTGVVGRYQNYFGVPELTPTAQFTSRSAQPAIADTITSAEIDSADVCRLVCIKNTIVDNSGRLDNGFPVVDKFDTGLTTGIEEDLTAIVMISWDEVQLWVVTEDIHPIVPLENIGGTEGRIRKEIRDGQLLIITPEGRYDAVGRMCSAGAEVRGAELREKAESR